MRQAIPHRVWWWAMILWVMATGALLWGGARLTYWNHLFATESRPAQGRITEKHYQVTHGRHGPSYTYYVGYFYEAENLHVQTETAVRPQTWNQVNTGVAIPVKYLADRPAESRIDYYLEENAYLFNARAVLGFGLFVLVAGTWGFTYAIWQNKVRKRLVEHGISCMGKISSVVAHNVGKGQIRNYLVFAFTDNRGNEIEGKSWDLKPNHEWRWKAGTPVRIYYDSMNSRLFTVDLGASD